MMDYGWNLVLGIVLSFIGSIPFGSINVTAAETALRQGLVASLWFSIGAAMIEFIQALLCLNFSGLLTNNPQYSTFFQWASIPVFIGMAVYFFIRHNVLPQTITTKSAKRKGFFKGVLISALNFLAYPYWIFISSWLGANGWLDLDVFQIILFFSIGVFMGTFLLLFLYAKLGILAGKKISKTSDLIGYFLSGFFLMLALIQFVRMI